jgi:hypothetical protein
VTDVLVVLKECRTYISGVEEGAILTWEQIQRLDACIRALEARERDERSLAEMVIKSKTYFISSMTAGINTDEWTAIYKAAHALTAKPEEAIKR